MNHSKQFDHIRPHSTQSCCSREHAQTYGAKAAAGGGASESAMAKTGGGSSSGSSSSSSSRSSSIASGAPPLPQYFLVSPKLLQGVEYTACNDLSF